MSSVRICCPSLLSSFFFFNDTATTEIYTLSLHDALPICSMMHGWRSWEIRCRWRNASARFVDRKSTRLNSSHLGISYAVFCLKKKKKKKKTHNATQTEEKV